MRKVKDDLLGYRTKRVRHNGVWYETRIIAANSADKPWILLGPSAVGLLTGICLKLFGGYNVVIADLFEFVLEEIQKRPIDLMIADYLARDGDAFSFLRSLKSDPTTSHVPVVLFSGTEFDRSAVQEAGFASFWQMPVDPPEMLRRIDAILRERRIEAG